MTHLSDNEFVDLVDGALPTSRQAHVDTCVACASRAQALREALDDVGAIPPAEPSPLFWEHFSARVSAALDDEAAHAGYSGWTRLRSPAVAWAVAASMAMVMMVAALWRAMAIPMRPATAPVVSQAALPEERAVDDLDADVAWAIVRSAADGLEWEDAHAAGMTARPGSAERVVQELSGEERAELARLLENEMKRSGA